MVICGGLGQGTTTTTNAGSFDKLRTGTSTTQFAKCANRFAQEDTFSGLCEVQATEKDKIRGSLHYATDDETVRRFGRDDALLKEQKDALWQRKKMTHSWWSKTKICG